MAMTTRVVLTYRDYAALPNDGRKYEIHEGELSVTPAPGTRHQQISRNFLVALDAYVSARRLGEVLDAPIDVILSDTTIVQPDIVYVANDRRRLLTSRGIEGPPTLVVEILSPSTIEIDRHTKSQLYARHGVPYYWIVDPEACSVEVYVLAEGGYRLSTRAAGDESLRAEPFRDLVLTPDSLWR